MSVFFFLYMPFLFLLRSFHFISISLFLPTSFSLTASFFLLTSKLPFLYGRMLIQEELLQDVKPIYNNKSSILSNKCWPRSTNLKKKLCMNCDRPIAEAVGCRDVWSQWAHVNFKTTCHECKTWYWRTMMLNLAHILVVIHKMSWMRCHRQIVIDGMSWKGFKWTSFCSDFYTMHGKATLT